MHQRLGVHILVEQAQTVKVQRVITVFSFFKQIKRRFQRFKQVSANLVDLGQIELPAGVVRYMGRVPPAVCIGLDAGQARMCGLTARAQCALRIAGYPPFLEPANMPQLPQGWIHRLPLRHDIVDRFERILILRKKVQRMIARIHQRQ